MSTVIPFPKRRRQGWAPLVVGVLAFCLVLFCIVAARAQNPPLNGQPVFNQAVGGRALTKSDTTVIQTTRAVYIGDAAACNIAVRFAGDSAAVTLANVQSGATYPFSIVQLMSTNTTCTAVTALY